jgi:hypothetical protein
MYDELKDIVLQTVAYKKHNDVHLKLEFTNGSSINFKSAAQREGLRGYTCNGVLVIDEAAYISDEIFASILAWTNVHQPPIIICSTPAFKKGFFYDYFTNNDKKTLKYDWNKFDTSSLLPADRLEMYRKTLPPQVFKTDYLGEFLDLEGSVFGKFDSIIGKEVNEGNIYMGIDWGSGNGKDYTAISVINDSY